MPNAQPLVKAKDVTYVRFSAPDLERMEQFVRDFGLVVVHRDEDILISRALEATPYVHVVHRGPAKCIGVAFEVDSADDLQKLADGVAGCSAVHDIGGVEGELGGGRRVHFVEPNSGFLFEAVHGRTAEPLEPRRARHTFNHGGVFERVGELQDVSGNRSPIEKDPGPPEILRLGHCVIAVPVGPHQGLMRFLSDTFGMIVSDAATLTIPDEAKEHFPPPLVECFEKTGSNVMAQFMRMDRGADHTDHHSIFVLPQLDPRAALPDGTPQAQLSHVAFECFSMDGVFRGHMSLREKVERGRPYAHAWGVGRHVYGSQVYDYWHDPYGHVHEHMCDGDRVDDRFGPHHHDLSEMGHNGGNQWGPTVAESGVQNLDGPQCAAHFEDHPDDVKQSLLSRDLGSVRHIIDSL